MTNETWAHLSNGLVVSSIIVLVLALVMFALDLANGTGQRRAMAERQQTARSERTAAGGVLIATQNDSEVTDVARWARVGVSLTTLAALLLWAAVLSRGISAGRPPWGNMYEFTVTGVTVLLTVWLGLVARRSAWRDLGIVVVLFGLVLLGIAVLVLYTASAQLVPALKSYWLWIHVTAAIVSSGVFTIGSLASVLFLVSDRHERRLKAKTNRGVLDALGARLPRPDVLDKFAYQSIAFAFPLWLFAVVAGSVWAEDAWGRYWGWDPKETWAFIAWVVYAAYLHARATAGWKGRSAAWINLLGFSAMTFNFFVVNVVISGLHSYAGLN
jgi:cytochrome c-type biogenesis protein CcsB